MLEQAKEAGQRAALERFKLAWSINPREMLNSGVNTAKWMAYGQAPRVFAEGAKTFQPGGAMHWRNVFWPTMPESPWMQRIGRAGTVLSLGMLPGMVHRDQARGEGTLSSVLGGVGGLAGMMYGGTAGGALGQPLGMALGHGLGKGVGHLLGSRKADEYP